MTFLSIINKCIACDACRDVCPTDAIEVGDSIYMISTNKCILCVGYSTIPNCIEVCPIDAIVYETQDSKNDINKLAN